MSVCSGKKLNHTVRFAYVKIKRESQFLYYDSSGFMMGEYISNELYPIGQSKFNQTPSRLIIATKGAYADHLCRKLLLEEPK